MQIQSNRRPCLAPDRGKGFTLVELMIVISILGLLLGIATPSLIKARTRARQHLCVENLSQIESAKQLWGVENGKSDGDVAPKAELVGPTLYIKQNPICPAAGSYDFKSIGTTATCTEDGHGL